MGLGSGLFHARKKSGLSQENVAEKLGVSRQTISKWEKGLSVPDSDMLLALSEALELPEWYGRSLDALYDCLTDLSVPTTIHMENWPEEDYMQRALAVLRDAAEENELLQVRLED